MPSRGEPLTGYNKRCPVCGKEFWAYGDWSYKKTDRKTKRRVYYCSWKCIRTTEPKEEKKEKTEKNEIRTIPVRYRCLICGRMEPEWDGRVAEEMRDHVCTGCKETVLFVRKFVQMIEERKVKR